MGKQIVPLQFEGADIRVTPDGKISAVDALKAMGQKNAKASWRHLKHSYPELVQETCTYSFGGRGRPSEVLSERGALKLAMLAKGPRSEQFRDWVTTQLQRIARADATLAAEIIDRQTDPQKVEWLARRAENKSAAITLNAAIQRHGGSQNAYGKVHDVLNVAVTGMTARQIRQRGQRITKNNLDTSELTLSTMSQIATTSGLEQRRAQGDGQIISVATEVSADIAAFRRKWLGDRPFPSDGLIQTLI